MGLYKEKGGLDRVVLKIHTRIYKVNSNLLIVRVNKMGMLAIRSVVLRKQQITDIAILSRKVSS